MKITIDDGFSFGLGVFETIAIENGSPQFLEEHIARLEAGAKALAIENPDFSPRKVMADAVKEVRACQRMRGVLKITLTQQNILFTQRDNSYTQEDYERGFSVRLSPIIRNESSPFTYVKSLNYGDNILEKRRAHREGFDEPIFLNTRGELTEGATTNLFVVKDGHIYTPPVSAGLLDGIYRQAVMRTLPVEEHTLFPKDIEEAEGVFLTNSLLKAMPVRRFEEKNFDISALRALIQRLHF